MGDLGIRMNIVALIPARAGSSLKDKNIYPLGGYPLLAWLIACAKMSCYIKSVYVYTDSERYAKIARQYDAMAPFYDDNPLIGEVPNHVFIKEFVDQREKYVIEAIDYLVIIWATNPLRDVKYVDEAITGFLVSNATSLKSVVEMSESAYKAMKIENGYLCSLSGDTANIPRQQIPKTYHPNGYVDIMRGDLIREGKGWGDKVLPFLCEDVGEIDTANDIKQVERLLAEGIGGNVLEYLRITNP